MRKGLQLNLNRTHLAMLLAFLFVCYIVSGIIVRHTTGIHLTNWLVNNGGYYWPYANWLAASAVGILVRGGSYALSVAVPVLAPIAIFLAALLSTYGANWLIVW